MAIWIDWLLQELALKVICNLAGVEMRVNSITAGTRDGSKFTLSDSHIYITTQTFNLD